MKFIHCSDLHLGSKLNDLSLEQRKRRKEELISTFERLCDYATENEVTAVIIAGDVFDSDKISEKLLLRVLNAIEKNYGVDFLYLAGNHELNALLDNSDRFPKNLKFFTDEWTCFKYGDITVSGVLLTKKNSTLIYDTLKLSPENVNVVTMHGQVAGYKMKEDAHVISLPMLKEKNVDYLALGHYHTFADGEIDYRGRYAYSGCLDGRGFDEIGKKGFVLIEIENKKLSYNFVEFCSRVIHEAKFDVTGENNFAKFKDKLILVLVNNVAQNDIVKVVLTGEKQPEFEIDLESLNYKLNEKFFYAKIVDKTSLLVRLEDYALDKSVRGEFVRILLESDLPKETKDAVLSMGLSALKGELNEN